MSEKLQKVLARAGLGSRREIETWIEDGRLMVNGYPALLGTRVEPKDEVKLDGRRLRLVPESLVNRKILMYHKPEGEVTTRKDPEGRPTVFDRLPPMRGSRWVAIGRLDLNTSGLLIFTNDGEMANRLMHPSHEVEREYAVRILGELKPSQRKQLLEGVVLEDGLAKFNSIESRGGSGTNRWYHVTLSEGRTREVRRMFESLQLVVSRLIRVRYGPVSLDPLLKQGMNRLLTLEESDRLCEAVGIEPQAPRAERRREYQQTRRSEPVRGRVDSDDEFGDDVAPVSARKAKVIGSKSDELPLDRVERAAELLRRRREAESAGVEFSGRSGRLSGKRTLRESELRKIAQEKAAEKAKRATGKTGAARADSDDRETPRTRSRNAAAASAGRERPVAPGARSAASRIAATRSTTTRTGLARSTSYAERDDDDVTPRRAPRAGARTRSSEEEAPRRTTRTSTRTTPRSSRTDEDAPRRRSAAKPAGTRSAAGARSSRSEDSARPARSRSADSDRTVRSRAGADADRPSRSADARNTGRGGAGKTSASRSAASTARSTGKPASRSAAGKSASSASRTSPRASSARAGSSARSSSARPSTSPRGGGRSGGGAKPTSKGKRTR